MENDETTTVGSDLQLELPSANLGFTTKVTYKFRIGINLTKTVVHPTTCMVDIGAGHNLIN